MTDSRPTLFLGSKDRAAIARLVELLRDNGFWSDDVPDLYTKELEAAVRYFQSTHIDAERAHLAADGIVGPRTWWALENASGTPQRSEGLSLTIPSGLSPLRTRVLEVALGEFAQDVVEVPNGRNRGPALDKYLPSWALKPNEKGPAWCCYFYSWVVTQALGASPLGRHEGKVVRARSLAVERGLWIPNSRPNRPTPGDAFVIDHGNGTGHIGFVVRVSDDGLHLNTVEGNLGNRVDIGLRETRGASIAGFINNVPGEADPSYERGVTIMRGLRGVSVV